MKKPGLVIKIAIGIAIVIVIGSAAVISVLIWDPFWSPFRPSPKEVLKEASLHFTELKTFHFDIFFEKETIRTAQSTAKSSMSISGDLDITNREVLKWKGETKSSADFDRGEFSFGWEKIIIGGNSWLKLTSLPSSKFLDFFAFDLNIIKNQWIKLEKESFKDLFGRLSAESELEVIKKILTNESFFRFRGILPDENINEKETYRYLFDLEKEEFRKLVPEISKLLPIDAECLERFEEIKAEVWIGKEDKLIYKVNMESEVYLQEYDETEVIRVDVYLSEFNMPLEIKPPQQFKLFEDIFETKDFNFFSFPEQL